MYLFETELFKMELFICIKKNLSLNNLQWLICHKTKPKKTQSDGIKFYLMIASNLKISLWIFTSSKVCPTRFNFTFQIFMSFVMKFMTLSDSLYIFRHSIIKVCIIILSIFLQSIHMATFFHFVFTFLKMC